MQLGPIPILESSFLPQPLPSWHPPFPRAFLTVSLTLQSPHFRPQPLVGSCIPSQIQHAAAFCLLNRDLLQVLCAFWCLLSPLPAQRPGPSQPRCVEGRGAEPQQCSSASSCRAMLCLYGIILCLVFLFCLDTVVTFQQ